MKNKRYRVWMTQCYSVDIDAKEIQIISFNNKPLRVRFIDENDYMLAEFYCDMICGWAQVDCITDYNSN